MAGQVLDRTEVAYDAAGATGEDIGRALAAAAELLAAHDLQGVGVAAAGLVDPLAGLILEVNDVPAAARLSGRGAARRAHRDRGAGGAAGEAAGARRPLVRRGPG